MAEVAVRPEHRSAPGMHGRPKLAAWRHQPKILIGEEQLDLRSAHQLLQKAADELIIEQPLAVISEYGEEANRIVGAQADNPAV